MSIETSECRKGLTKKERHLLESIKITLAATQPMRSLAVGITLLEDPVRKKMAESMKVGLEEFNVMLSHIVTHLVEQD